MKEVYMIYTSCKIHVAHTYHTRFVLPNALKSKKNAEMLCSISYTPHQFNNVSYCLFMFIVQANSNMVHVASNFMLARKAYNAADIHCGGTRNVKSKIVL